MQNLKLLLAALAVGGAVSSCSDSTDVNNGGSQAQWNADGTGYISLAINLPTQTSNSGTRASNSNNDQFDDGEASEYRVKDATLLLFNGDTEADAKFAGAYNLDLNWNMNGSSTDNVTSTAKIVRKINQTDGKLWALVLLNGKTTGIYSSDQSTADRDEADATPKIKGSELTENTTLKSLQETTVNNEKLFLNNSYFFMTNAPLTNVPSAVSPTASFGTVQTLAPVAASAVYSTEQEANNNDPAATINVERSMAKVNVSSTGTATNPLHLKYNSNVDYQDKQVDCTVISWALDNTNSASYIVRNTQTTKFNSWKKLRSEARSPQLLTTGFRFQGAAKVGTQDLYRTYWALDPNYDGSETSAPTLTSVTDTDLSEDVSKPQYCFENTFNVANQKQNKTTRAIICVQYGDGKSNYYAYSNQTATLQSEANFFSTMKALLKTTPQFEAAKASIPTPDTYDDNKLVVGVGTPTNGIVELTVKYDGTAWADCAEALNALRPNIAQYEDGKAYYSVLIKHFGDELTPWNGTGDNKEWTTGNQPKAGIDINSIYPTTPGQDANYLGRYGVLRNNWYNINVTGVEKIGSPVIPSDNDFPDDEIETYLKVEINILAWAKRTQDTVLK